MLIPFAQSQSAKYVPSSYSFSIWKTAYRLGELGGHFKGNY